MNKPEDLPIYKPEFKMRSQYRMTVLRIDDGPRPKGGLAIVWGEGKMTQKILLGRRPAVMRLPEMWTRDVRSFWEGDKDARWPPEEYDQLWSMSARSMGWSMDDEEDRAMGGSWVPCRQNILVQMFKSKNTYIRALAADTSTRCWELLAEEDLCCPYWMKSLPLICKRCGGTGNIGLISSVRCPEC